MFSKAFWPLIWEVKEHLSLINNLQPNSFGSLPHWGILSLIHYYIYSMLYSGPKRFDYDLDKNEWVDPSGCILSELLKKEFKQVANFDL